MRHSEDADRRVSMREGDEDMDRRIAAVVKSQRTSSQYRRKPRASDQFEEKERPSRNTFESERPARDTFDEKERPFPPGESPPLPSPAVKESVEVPNFRFSLASDASSLPEQDGDGIDGHLNARPPPSRGESVRTQATGRSLPELTRKETKLAQKESHPWQHLGITLGGPMIILFDLVIPCVIYYTWYNNHTSDWHNQCASEYPNLPSSECPIPYKDYDKDILGYAVICFGFGELWILLARLHRLFVHHEQCAPLLSRSRWELDATSWVYAFILVLALIPFVVGSSLEIIHLYLYSPTFIMGFLGLLMAITTFFPFPLPFNLNSQVKGTQLRPFIYYAAEDFIAVDGLQDREFRIRYNERYETNKMFRNFFFNLTLWWMLGVLTYIGAVSAVIWCTPFHIAFGLSFGVLFTYIATWAGVTFFWVKYEMAREHRAYEQGAIDA